ncbi:MAG: hypothetical protein JST54_27220 [Deltaproteobacteria bacterium]|nr:hypothetical protein [Deltaproteobacteria bacterium]
MVALPAALLALALGANDAALSVTDNSGVHTESPITGMWSFSLGGYTPQVDSEPGLTAAPYQQAFDNHSILLFEAEWDRELWQRFGSLALGVSAGYGEIYGKGMFASNGATSSDNTALKVVPLKLLGTYNFNVLARRYGVPLVPFAKGGIVWELYRITNGAGDTATAGGDTGQGGRWGWEGDLGLALMLDWFDPTLAKNFDIDVGVNHTYFFAEFRYMSPVRNNPFAGPTGIYLNDKYWTFGLALEY